MPFITADNVRETSTTSGTGALTLAGAVSGYRRFRDVVSAVGDQFDYRITDGTAWEVGVGTYSGTDTLTRTKVLYSSNSNAAVNFSNNSKDVVLTLLADRAAAIGKRNVLVNSSFRFWQRGNPITCADGAMGPDGWFLLSESGSVVVSPGSNWYGTGIGKFAVASVSSTQRIGFGQVLWGTDVYNSNGGSDIWWLQAHVTAPSAVTVRIAVLYNTGTADAAARDMVNNWASTTYTAGNFFHANWAPLAVASMVPGLSGGDFSLPVEISSGLKNIGILIWTQDQLTSGQELSISEPILSPVGVPQRYAPPDYGAELAACQRRFCKTFPLATAPADNAGFNGSLPGQSIASSIDPEVNWRFPVTMGKTPTVALFNPTSTTAGQWAGWAGALANARSYYPSENGAVIDNTDVAAASTASFFIHATSEAEPCS